MEKANTWPSHQEKWWKVLCLRSGSPKQTEYFNSGSTALSPGMVLSPPLHRRHCSGIRIAVKPAESRAGVWTCQLGGKGWELLLLVKTFERKKKKTKTKSCSDQTRQKRCRRSGKWKTMKKGVWGTSLDQKSGQRACIDSIANTGPQKPDRHRFPSID